MKDSAATHELMPLKTGDSKEAGRPEKSSDADKKNWMSSVQLGSNNVAYTSTKNHASHNSSSVTPFYHFLGIFNIYLKN